MKVFRLNTYMQLPDDFAGTYADAVQLWLTKYAASDLPPPAINASMRVANEPFFLNQRYGFSVLAETGIWEHVPRPRGSQGPHTAWVRTDKNPEFCYASDDTWIK